MNPINGASAIGYGFNALGAYDPSSLKSQVFSQSFKEGCTYTYQPTGITYKVPDNVSVLDFSPRRGGSQVFNSQFDLQSYLAVLAGIDATYGAFSGEINAYYSSARNEWGSCFYALTNAWIGEWMLMIKEVDQSMLDPNFKTALNQLPTEFEQSDPYHFFDFFAEYGTHYVHSVGVGGFFCYYSGISQLASYTKEEVLANVDLEYNAVFVDASAQSIADWAHLGQSWSLNRVVNIQAQGGNASILADLSPTFDTNASASYDNWLKSISANPSAVQYTLSMWSDLFPTNSDHQKAIMNATKAFMNYNIYVKASVDWNGFGLTEVVVLGSQVDLTPWPSNQTYQESGIAVVLIDEQSKDILFSTVYYFSDPEGNNHLDLYNRLIKDLGEQYIENSWCAISVFNYPWGILPDERLTRWLAKFGIDDKIWRDNYYNCGDGGISYNYLAIGKHGKTGVESFSIAYPDRDTTTELNVHPYLSTRG
jgi:hypothetical protein